jgi:hypothetical protein
MSYSRSLTLAKSRSKVAHEPSGSSPALPECSVIVEGFGRTGLPDCFERSVNTSELLQQADGGVLARRRLDVTDELLKLGPAITGPQEDSAGNPNRPRDADLRPPEPLPQAPQSRYPPAADPGPVNPEDKRRLSVYPHVEVELTADVCPSGLLGQAHTGRASRQGAGQVTGLTPASLSRTTPRRISLRIAKCIAKDRRQCRIMIINCTSI